MSYNKEDSIYYIWLAGLPGVGCITARKLIAQYGSPKEVYSFHPGVNKDLSPAKKIFEICEKQRITILTLDNPVYPDSVKSLTDQPILLYAKGNIPTNYSSVLAPENSAAIIGPRRCSGFVRDMTIDIGTELIASGKTIISGMALGVDSYAHTAAIKNNGFTVAFLGFGLDRCYPNILIRLKESIIENGLLISEYAPGTPALRYNFPARNRLIAAWAGEINVVGVHGKSGTESTIRAAKSYGHTVNIIN